MTEKFRSYVPELLFGEHKQEASGRICHEDFVVIDPSDRYRILTGRGLYAQAGYLFPKVWQLPRAEIEWMEGALPDHRRVLLDGKDGPVLVFADLLDSTGLLFAVRPYLSSSVLVCGLRHLQLCDVALSPTLGAQGWQSLPDESRLTQITELFYYMDRMFDTTGEFSIGPWTRAQLIANFVGCKLEQVELPIAEPAMMRSERDRLTAFLICAFLEMRKMDGRVSAFGEGIAPRFRCRVELTPLGRLAEELQSRRRWDFPILDLPPFENFELRRSDGKVVLEALLQDGLRDKALHAGLPCYLRWCIVLEEVS